MNLKPVTAQLARVWSALSGPQRLSIALAVLGVIAGLSWFTTHQKEGDFRPAFSGMSSEDAGAVVAKLKEAGVEYRLSETGGSVMVPSARVAEVRLQMAAAGLPRTGRIGFELFDKINIGTSDFAEQVNYRRALEGELERSIRAISEVEQARVHLSFAKDSVFTESKQPAKASVLLTVRTGAQVTEGNIRAMVHLVSSAVEGLAPEAVSITDSAGNLLNRPKKPHTPGEASDELIEFRQKLERDLAAKVNATLEPLLGAGRFRVGMSVDCDFTSGEQSEELYDPEKSVMLTTQKTEEITGTSASGGVPGTGSNLPRPTPRSASSSGGITRRTENVSYQTSHTVRRTQLPQGTIRRISASVLLDQSVRWDVQNGKQNRVLVPPTAESMQAIRELVAANVGLVPARGDQLVIQSLPFETTLSTAPPPLHTSTAPAAGGNASSPATSLPVDWRLLAGGAAALLAIGGTAYFILRRRKKAKKQPGVQMTQSLPASAGAAVVAGGPESFPLEGGEQATRLLARAQERVVQTARIESLVEELRAGIASDPALAASVLRTWLEDGEPPR